MKQNQIETQNTRNSSSHLESDPKLKELAERAATFTTDEDQKNEFMSAPELQLTEFQYTALIKTLDLMENGKISEKEYINDKRFNMSVWAQDKTCGTVCCIGGTASLLAGEEYNYNAGLRTIFHSKETGLFTGSMDLMNLFYYWGQVPVTVPRAAQQLREYLKTGKCPHNWAIKGK